MNKDALVRGGVDYDDALARFMGSVDLYERFLLKFPSDPTFPALRESIRAENAEDAFYQAHTLKGVAGNLSFRELSRQVVPLVEALRVGDMAGAQALYPALEMEYDRLCAMLQAESP